MTDLAQDVLDLAERAVRHSGAGSDGFRVAVTWAPAETEFGWSVAWILLITLPSHILGSPPLGLTTSPIVSPSLPREHEISAAVADALPKLRAARLAQREKAMASGTAARSLSR